MADEHTPQSFDDSVDPSATGGPDPAGEQLADLPREQPAEEYVVMDDEAEELTGEPVADATPGHADPQDMVVDDPQQLADAEALAAQARSSRPRRRNSSAGQPDAVPALQPRPTDLGPASAASGQSPVLPAQGGGATAAPSPEVLAEQAAAVASVRPVRRTREVAEPERRAASGNRAVRRNQPREVAASRRTTPAAFVGQSAAELRKVIWPTGAQLGQYFVVVLLFVLFIVAYVGLLDLFFGWGLLKLFGKK